MNMSNGFLRMAAVAAFAMASAGVVAVERIDDSYNPSASADAYLDDSSSFNSVARIEQKVWFVRKSETLRDNLARWHKESGVDVIWDASIVDVELSADAALTGSLDAAMLKLMTSLQKEGINLQAERSMLNNYIRIFDK